MRKHEIFARITALMLAVSAVLLFFVFPVRAEFKNTPVMAYIPVVCEKAKNVSGSNKYEVVIEKMGDDAPMPESDVITFNGSGSRNIEIEVDEPGTYQYKLYERKGKNKNIKYDTTEYNVTLFATQDDEGVLACEVILSKGGLSKPTVVKFVNKATKGSDSVIATGETASAFIPYAVGAFAVSGMIMIMVLKRRRREEEDA